MRGSGVFFAPGPCGRLIGSSGAKQPPVLARAAVACRALGKGVAEKEPVREDLDDGKALARRGSTRTSASSSARYSASQASVMHMSGCQQKVCCTSQPQMTASKAAPSRIAWSMYVRKVMIVSSPCCDRGLVSPFVPTISPMESDNQDSERFAPLIFAPRAAMRSPARSRRHRSASQG